MDAGGVTPDDELVIRLAFILAKEMRKMVQEAEVQATEAAEAYWRGFLVGKGLAHIYRQSVLLRSGIMIEQEEETNDTGPNNSSDNA